MSIPLTDNIKIGQPKPIDSRYFNDLLPWASTAAVNNQTTGIPDTLRYIGLSVNINGVEYWYNNGVADGNLVVKSVNLSGYVPYTGATTTVDLGTQNIKTGNAYFYDFESTNYVRLNGTKDRFNFINSAGVSMGYFGSNVIRMINGSYYGSIQLGTLTDNSTYTLPDKTGTIALTSDIGITAINSITSAAQTLTVGTTGTDFTIVDSGTDHKFNLPTASAVNTGKLSSTDWATFNSKQNSNIDLVNRRLGYTVSTDFLSPVSANLSPYAFSAILAGILVLINNIIDTDHPGVQQIVSAVGVANSGGLVATHTNTNSYSTVFTNGLQTDLIFKLPPITANNYIRFGHSFGSISITPPSYGNYFEINGTTLAGITRSGGVQSSTSTYTLIADTWYHLRIKESIVGGTNTVTFNIFDMNGTLLYNQSSTTNIQTTNTRANVVIGVNTVSATALSIIYLDYIGLTFPAMIRGALN